MNSSLEIQNNRSFPILIGLNYLALLIIALLWTNKNLVEPNIILRILFTILFALPLFKYPHLAPAIVTIFVSIRLFSVAPFGYLPSAPLFYFILGLAIFIFHPKNLKEIDNEKIRFLILLPIILFSNAVNFNLKYDFIVYLCLIYIMGHFIKTKAHVKLIEIGFVIVTFSLSVYALVFLNEFAVEIYGSNFNRVYWTDPNYLGSVIAIGIVISFYYIINNEFKKYFYRIFVISTFVLGIITLGLLASRGAFIAIILPLIYIIFTKNKSIHKLAIYLVLGAIFIYIISLSNIFGGLIDRFNDDSISSGSGRIFIWEKSLSSFSNSDPFTIFFGGGTDYSNELTGKSIGRKIFSPHNNFLAILYDYGIIGLISFLFIFYKLVKEKLADSMAIALIMLLGVVSLTLVPLMYLPFWLLILTISKRPNT
ncbi:O-antigen ligase family protein [Mariniphaga sp.]|uniref:O-antigen ligase family protein n=1 Tax=Mariniphaga sp. TaxID=1954475 RepID=UPI0035660612